MSQSYDRQRRNMVDRQIEGRGVADLRLLQAMREVPREAFLPDDLKARAYADGPLPLIAGQTISQPYIVARMLEAAALQPSDRVLDVGTGSGYAAAVASRLCAFVDSMECVGELAEGAARSLRTMGYDNVEVHLGDGADGLVDRAPFDAILAAAAAPRVPESLKRQLAQGGRLVMPIGDHGAQTLVKLTRHADDFREEQIAHVRFVPLVTSDNVAT